MAVFSKRSPDHCNGGCSLIRSARVERLAVESNGTKSEHHVATASIALRPMPQLPVYGVPAEKNPRTQKPSTFHVRWPQKVLSDSILKFSTGYRSIFRATILLDMQRIAYSKASDTWEGPHFRVVDQSGQRLLSIPVDFARTGLCNTIEFAISQVSFCFVEDGHLRCADGRVLTPQEPLFAGTAIFVRADQSQASCTPRLGPRFKSLRRAPADGSEASTVSNSRRSSTNQNHFKMALVARDTCCLLSAASWQASTGCHILPQSRSEYYAEIFEDEVDYLFRPEYGLLLRDDLHHAFDRGQWALHQDGENLIVHFFDADIAGQSEYHGKIIRPDRFHTPASTHPNRALLRFHYQQCSMRKLRGIEKPAFHLCSYYPTYRLRNQLPFVPRSSWDALELCILTESSIRSYRGRPLPCNHSIGAAVPKWLLYVKSLPAWSFDREFLHHAESLKHLTPCRILTHKACEKVSWAPAHPVEKVLVGKSRDYPALVAFAPPSPAESGLLAEGPALMDPRSFPCTRRRFADAPRLAPSMIDCLTSKLRTVSWIDDHFDPMANLVASTDSSLHEERVQLRNAKGNALEGLDVFAIDSLFLHPLETDAPLTIIEFPQGKSRFRAPNVNPSESTYSASSNATGRSGQASNEWRFVLKPIDSDARHESCSQTDFRNKVCVRDQACLLTHRGFGKCVAAHLAPVSRPDLTASASQDGVYYFHHFTSDKDFRPHHGTTIVGQTKWHLFEPYDWPNAELLQCEPHIHLAASLSFGADQAKFHPSGHYQQCVIANFCV
ncbi:hypothetical protein U1Q18_044786 [Sarracenia purpurea var. burkii]